jgi:hypothetical protein
MVTGISLQRDAKGHVTGITADIRKMPQHPSLDTPFWIVSGLKADDTTNIQGAESHGGLTYLGDSGVAPGKYGPTSNQTPGYGATFNVPEIKVNAKGIVTSVTNRTVKIPNSDNTHYTTTLWAGANNDTKSHAATTTTDNYTYLKLFDDNSRRSTLKIQGSGAAKVTSSADGVITIAATNTSTHYTTTLWAGADNTTRANAETANGATYLKLFDDATRQSKLLIQGDGATTVTSNANGVITIHSPEQRENTHYTSKNIVGAAIIDPKKDKIENSAYSGTDGVYLHHFEDNTLTSVHKIKGRGAAKVTSDTSGNITINSTNSTTKLYVGVDHDATTHAKTTNKTTYLKLFDDSTRRSTIQIQGDGATKVTANAGVITISSTDDDTHYTTALYAGANDDTQSNAATTTTNNYTYLKLFDDSTRRSTLKIQGAGITKVNSDASGNITITSPDKSPTAGTNISVSGTQVSVVTEPKFTSISVGSTTTSPVKLQYDSTLGALNFVFS